MARTGLWLGPGLALGAWAVDFAVMYAAATFWCERPVVGWIATLGCAAIALAALVRSARSPRSADGDQDTERLGRDAAIVISVLASSRSSGTGSRCSRSRAARRSTLLFLCRPAPDGRDSPHDVADIIGDEQRAGPIDRHADRPAERVAVAHRESP